MNAQTKRRMIVVSGIIVIVLIVMVAIASSSSAAKSVTIAELARNSYGNQKVQVSGNVVPHSYSAQANALVFEIYDPDDPATHIRVNYDGAASSTFGNDVTAICTGRMGDDGTLACTELVTKCPSKYESGTDALSVARMLGYGDAITGTMVKVTGIVADDSLQPAGSGQRFALLGLESDQSVPVDFDGALPDGIQSGSAVVLTGSMNADGSFLATDVALER